MDEATHQTFDLDWRVGTVLRSKIPAFRQALENILTENGTLQMKYKWEDQPDFYTLEEMIEQGRTVGTQAVWEKAL